jgi:non-ribosomal peptide synthetase component E (peptide arylation enzyme)/thioesterase domain-containing protein
MLRWRWIFVQFSFVPSGAPESTAWLEPGKQPASFAEVLERAASIRRMFLEAQIPPGSIIAAGNLAPLDFATAFLAASSSWAFAAVSPNLTAHERQGYLEALRPHSILDGGMVLHPQPQPRFIEAALCLSTSATTGNAKIVPRKLAQLEASARNTSRAFGLTPADRFLCFMPLHHLQGFGFLLAQWLAGGSVAYTGALNIQQFPRWLEEFQPTWFTGGPAALDAIRGTRSPVPHRLRFIQAVGAPLPPATLAAIEDLFQVPVIESYGLTETGLVASNPLPPRPRKPGFVGPSAGPEITIAPNGEILVRGPSLFTGYLNSDVQPFDSEGWFHTGDIGEFDSDGYLRILGRMKEIVNRGGEKIFPGEVDHAVAAHPAVLDAAAFSIPHSTLGEDLACAVALRPGASVSAADLHRFCRLSLAPEKLPRHFLFVERIPRGPTGKPQRHRLRISDSVRGSLANVPRRLIELWAEALRTQPTSGLDNFFLRGGDSLRLAGFLSAVSAEYSIALEQLDSFFDNPTLDGLASLIASAAAASVARDRLTWFPHAPGSHLFLVAPTADHVFAMRALALELGPLRPVTILRTTGKAEDYCDAHVAGAARDSLAVIREVQPRGPYLLAGYCYGGIVAFETARLLAESDPALGGGVRRLVLLDAPCPGPRHLHARWRFFDPLFRFSPRPAVLSRPPLPLRIDVHQVYATRPPSRTLLFEDNRLSWRRFTSGGFHLHPVDSDHESLMLEPAACELATLLRSILSD